MPARTRRSESHSRLEPLESRRLFSATFAHHGPTHKFPHATTDLAIIPHVTNTTPTGYTPAQVAHAYNFDKVSFAGGVKGTGAGQTIAIVDAYDDPNIASDLATFSAKYNLPAMNGTSGHPLFSELKAAGVTPNAGWSLEIALDVEWAHAIAPQANIVLVEARSASLGDLLSAVTAARTLTSASVVSMSWGSSEFSGETSYDSYFTTPAGHTPMTFVASSGDSGAPASWPAISPNVLSVGGSHLSIDSAGNYLSESTWSGSGGGASRYEPRPTYQTKATTSTRANPDVSYDADPNTGVPVYDSVTLSGQSGWFQVGGTSAGAPQWAALVAIANQGRAAAGKATLNGRSQLLPALYNAPAADFHDITTGKSTGIPAYAATTGYDLATGLGSPKADLIDTFLVNA